MPRIDVTTDELAAGGSHQAAVAAAIGGSAGLVRAAGAAIAGAAGHAGAATAGSDWGAAWEAELSARADVVGRSAHNLDAAAAAYEETDGGQIRT
jgi:Excreted virulence factor EspC, type VII ESX diderm